MKKILGTVTTIGISGPSASGKSTLSLAIAEKLLDATILHQDVFFLDSALCPPDANFCDPKYLHVDQFVKSATLLSQGHATTVPEIDYSTFSQTGVRELRPSRYLIIEGMTIFRYSDIYDLLDRRFYLASPWSLIKKRKQGRDAFERKKTEKIIRSQLRWMQKEYEKDMRNIEKTIDLVRNTHLDEQISIILNSIFTQ